MLEQYGHIFLYTILGITFTVVTLGISSLLRTRTNDPKKLTSYECGMEPVGSTDVRFNIRFYSYALLFVLFDVEAVYLFPWAVTVRSLGVVAFLEMAVFLGILFLGLIYAWKKGTLQWE